MHKYKGKSLTVGWDKNVCIHAGKCGAGLPAVFNVKNTPWIQPDNADDAAVLDRIKACPSGALTIENG